jgi:YfiH family protein
MATLKQIHSNRCLLAERPGLAGEGDALITRAAIPVSVRTADCFPILLADPSRRAVAAIHAGWRGTASGIVGETLRSMREHFGTSPQDVFAAIGPGIGACCYHVGEEVARRFGLDRAGKIDLAAANAAQLIAAGVPRAQIDVMAECTFCHPDRFHSFRRDGEQAGRMISYISIPP